MELHNYVFSKLVKDYYVRSFCCSDKDLTNFLLEDAKNYQRDLMAVTYLFETPDLKETVAYFSLLNDKDAYANATGFYQKCGFEFFSHKDNGDSTRLMFMDLKPYKKEFELLKEL